MWGVNQIAIACTCVQCLYPHSSPSPALFVSYFQCGLRHPHLRIHGGAVGVQCYGGRAASPVILQGNEIFGHTGAGVYMGSNARIILTGNIIRDHLPADALYGSRSPGYGIYVDSSSRINATAATENVFARNAVSDIGGPGWAATVWREADERRLPTLLPEIATWWDTQHSQALEARAAGTAPPDWVFPPDAFDVTIAPGEDVQAGIERCPPGGSVLLLPGTHEGPLELKANKEVHVFGRGRAVLRAYITDTAPKAFHCEPELLIVESRSDVATIDGLVIRGGSEYRAGVYVADGGLRLVACDISAASDGVLVCNHANPHVIGCRHAWEKGRSCAAPALEYVYIPLLKKSCTALHRHQKSLFPPGNPSASILPSASCA